MFASLRLDSLSSAAFSNSFFSSDTIISQITQRIKEIVAAAFQKISDFFNAYNKHSNESNIKTFALISCLSLIALLVISMLRRRDSRLVPPPTPMKTH
jgi:glutaredoxin 2